MTKREQILIDALKKISKPVPFLFHEANQYVARLNEIATEALASYNNQKEENEAVELIKGFMTYMIKVGSPDLSIDTNLSNYLKERSFTITTKTDDNE